MSRETDSQTPPMRRPLSFVRRSNRLNPRRERLWEASLGQALLDIPHGERDTAVAEGFRIDWDEEFGRQAPLIVEIGSGAGEAIAAAAANHPDRNFLSIEVYKPGVASLLSRIREHGLTNVRIANLDATDVLDKLLPDGSVTELWTFFPDPWHKKKHHKRRLVQEDFLPRAARVLRDGGLWRLATDWSGYAVQIRDLLEASTYFRNLHPGERAGEDSALTQVRLKDLDAISMGKEPQPLSMDEALDHDGGWAPRFTGRIQTSFESKAIEAGRKIFDMTFTRTAHNGTAGYANDSWEPAAMAWSGREP